MLQKSILYLLDFKKLISYLFKAYIGSISHCLTVSHYLTVYILYIIDFDYEKKSVSYALKNISSRIS